MKKKYSLQRTMIVYFMLIVCASLLVAIEFVFDVQGSPLKEALLLNFEHFSNHTITLDQLFEPITELRNKAMIMIAIIMYVTIIVLTMLIKNITGPLQHMIDVSENISTGDLTQIIKIDSNNELARLGAVINEMSSNLQEVTMLSQNMSETGKQCTESIQQLLLTSTIDQDKKNDLLEQLEQLTMGFEMLQEFTECFRLYELDGEPND